MIYGECDLIAKVSVPSLEALEEFIAEKIRKVPSILVTSTMIITVEYKRKNNRTKKVAYAFKVLAQLRNES